MFYGGHVSIAKGILYGLKYMQSIGGNFIQIFLSNPISSKYKNKLSQDDFNDILSFTKISNMKIIIHLPYIINLAKSDNNNAVKLICKQLLVSNLLNSVGCVVHTGKCLKLTQTDCINNMYNTFVSIIDFIQVNKLNTKIILETPANQGTELLTNIVDLADFYNKFTTKQKKYFKICIDTCHIFASGIDIRSKNNVTSLFKELKKLIGLKNIAVIHLNDSKYDFNSHKDRHEDLGKGKIGTDGLIAVIKLASKYKIPLILETPTNYINDIELIKNNI